MAVRVCFLIALLAGVMQGQTAEEIYTQAMQLSQSGEPQQAIVLLRKAYKLTTERDSVARHHVHAGIARNLIDLKDYRDAIQEFHHALRYENKNPSVWGNLGWTYYLVDEIDSSIIATGVCLSIDSTLAYAWANYGLYHLKKGLFNFANRAYEHALQEIDDTATYEGAVTDLIDLANIEQSLKGIVEVKLKEFEDNKPHIRIRILRNEAKEHAQKGRTLEAEQLLKEILDRSRQLFKGDHTDVALSINSMASFLHDQGRASEAEPLYKEALEMYRRLFKGDHPDVAMSINNMAYFLNGQGRASEAEPLYLEALKMYLRLFNGDHPDLANSINLRALFLYRQGRASEAEPLLKEALKMYRRLFKGDHPDVAMSINNMAGFLNGQGRASEAEPLLKEALEMNRRLFKGDHPDVATSINNMALFLNGHGRASEAEPLLKESLEMRRRLFKGDHPILALSINNMAFFLNGQGRASEAEPLYKEALEIYRRLFKSDHPDVATSINNMASFLDDQGRASEAEPLYKEALEMVRRLFKGDHPDVALGISNMALFLIGQGRASEAEPLLKEALEMRRRLFKGDHPDVAMSINNMASFLTGQGRASEAEPHYKEALEMLRRLFKGDHAAVATSINNMASFLYGQGRASEAEPLLKEALEMRRHLFKGDHPDVATSINNMAYFFADQGRTSEAEPLYKEALEMVRRLFKGDHPSVATSINSMASFLDGQGRGSEAEPLYKEALEMRRRLFKGDHPDIAMSINNMASFLNGQGRTSEAEPLYKEALDMVRRLFKGDHPSVASSINNMASFLDGQGQASEAEPLWKESLEMRRRLFKGDHSDVALSINNMASFLYGQGLASEAEPLLKEALEMFRRLFKGNHTDVATSINNMAYFFADQGRTSEAEPLYKEALEMVRRLFKGDHPSVATSIGNMASFLDGQGRASEAEPLFIESAQMSLRYVQTNFAGLSEKEKSQFIQTVNYRFDLLQSFACQRGREYKILTSAIYDIQLSRKAMLLSESTNIRARILQSGDTVLTRLFFSWVSLKEGIAKGYSLTVDERTKRGIDIKELTQSANDLEKQLSRKSVLFAERYAHNDASWEHVRHALHPGEAAIEIIRFRYHDLKRWTDTTGYIALIVKQDTKENPEMLVFMNGKEMDSLYLEDYRSALKNKEIDKESYERYWGPIAEKLQGVKKVYLSSDGVYNLINVQTLLRPDGKYVLEDMDIQLVSNTKDIIRRKENRKPEYPRTAALFGYPNYELEESAQIQLAESFTNRDRDIPLNPNDTLARASCSPLPGTEKEVLEIGMTLKQAGWNVRAYMQNEALEEAVKAVRNPGVLHIATHGFFLEDKQLERRQDFERLMGFEKHVFVANPLLRSGLLLAGAKRSLGKNPRVSTEADNGILTAYEAMNLALDSTELVVLSACETGLGVVLNGEGVYGLQRSFLTAGARSVIMSLWRVSDDATQQLMRSFYSLWLKLKDKRKAFTQAQQELKKQFPEPFYWGAFVMVGE